MKKISDFYKKHEELVTGLSVGLLIGTVAGLCLVLKEADGMRIVSGDHVIQEDGVGWLVLQMKNGNNQTIKTYNE